MLWPYRQVLAQAQSACKKKRSSLSANSISDGEKSLPTFDTNSQRNFFPRHQHWE
jgi:hypothetical protein